MTEWAHVYCHLELVAEHPRLDPTAIQTVGAKGWNGFALVLVR